MNKSLMSDKDISKELIRLKDHIEVRTPLQGSISSTVGDPLNSFSFRIWKELKLFLKFVDHFGRKIVTTLSSRSKSKSI